MKWRQQSPWKSPRAPRLARIVMVTWMRQRRHTQACVRQCWLQLHRCRAPTYRGRCVAAAAVLSIVALATGTVASNAALADLTAPATSTSGPVGRARRGAADKPTQPSEAKALRALYEEWGRRPVAWAAGVAKYSDPCTPPWFGVTCTPGGPGDNYTHVSQLELGGPSTVSPQWGPVEPATPIGNGTTYARLPHLKVLNLNYLQMYNPTATAVGDVLTNLTAVEQFCVADNNFGGELPSDLRHLTKLNTVDVSGNHLSGSLPIMLPNSLTHFDGSSNSFAGSLPGQWSALPAPVFVNVYSNKLYGVLHRLPRSLVTLNIDSNGFTGNPFDALDGLPNVTSVILGHNDWSDSGGDDSWQNLDVLFGPRWGSNMTALPRLTGLTCASCGLRGTLPQAMAGRNWETLVLMSNGNIHGTLPESLYDITSLKELVLDESAITGSIAPSIGRLRHLSWFTITMPAPQYRGQLNGTLPDELWMPQLETLEFEGHPGLGGGLSPLVGNATSLQSLTLSRCNFSGTLPIELALLRAPRGNLHTLSLDNNLLRGRIPDPVGGWGQVTEFRVNNNSLSGPFPGSLAAASGIESVDVSDNKGLSGE